MEKQTRGVCMKRKAVLLLAAALVMTGLCACGTKTDTSSPKTQASSAASASAAGKSSGSAETSASGGTSNSGDSSAAGETVTDNKKTEKADNAKAKPDKTEAAVDAKGLTNALNACIGWGSDSGSTLKCASAAAGLVSWASSNPALAVSAGDIYDEFWKTLDQGQQQTFKENWEYIKSNGDTIFSDFNSIRGTLDDAGALKKAEKARKRSDAKAHWNALAQIIADKINNQ
jgi:hypothetical protein